MVVVVCKRGRRYCEMSLVEKAENSTLFPHSNNREVCESSLRRVLDGDVSHVRTFVHSFHDFLQEDMPTERGAFLAHLTERAVCILKVIVDAQPSLQEETLRAFSPSPPWSLIAYYATLGYCSAHAATRPFVMGAAAHHFLLLRLPLQGAILCLAFLYVSYGAQFVYLYLALVMGWYADAVMKVQLTA